MITEIGKQLPHIFPNTYVAETHHVTITMWFWWRQYHQHHLSNNNINRLAAKHSTQQPPPRQEDNIFKKETLTITAQLGYLITFFQFSP
jgi:elongation factor P--beta-lysine ligase